MGRPKGKKTSPKQRKANQQNSNKSTGPKNTENSRYNNLQHGWCSDLVVMPWEDPQMFDAYLDRFIRSYKPADSLEMEQVVAIAQHGWRMKRATPSEIDAAIQAENSQDLYIQVNRIALYEGRIGGSLAKAYKLLKHLKDDLAQGRRETVGQPEIPDASRYRSTYFAGPRMRPELPMDRKLGKQEYQEKVLDQQLATQDTPPSEALADYGQEAHLWDESVRKDPSIVTPENYAQKMQQRLDPFPIAPSPGINDPLPSRERDSGLQGRRERERSSKQESPSENTPNGPRKNNPKPKLPKDPGDQMASVVKTQNPPAMSWLDLADPDWPATLQERLDIAKAQNMALSDENIWWLVKASLVQDKTLPQEETAWMFLVDQVVLVQRVMTPYAETGQITHRQLLDSIRGDIDDDDVA